ncbi:MAG: putative 2-hydroxyglutaryl-CoA dehydratase [Streblomastix strix]|uniref:Putative 2-hydroxyglutaryl-CoA dehydratase n=1 Tax=Streblomastix strix TaxID=222440 RepID=A0A5J4UYE2_9EUKA|nr:MAG: putative 2-hydroxyglutaryl-CoA dehydratase [Streblomastix strix]
MHWLYHRQQKLNKKKIIINRLKSNLSKSSGSPQIQQQSTSSSTSSTVKLVPFGYPSPASYEAQIQQLQQKQLKEPKSSKGKEQKCDSCGGSYDGQPVGPDLIDSSITQGMSKIPKKPYTVLIHNFSFEHGPGYCAGMNAAGYNFLVCPDYEQQEMVNIGLRYVNNDCCYGTILIVGALLMSIEKKFVDPNLMHYCWIHMGGSCSSRCIGHYVRRAFIQAGYPQIGVTELNYNYLVNPELTIGQTMRVNFAFVIGDALTRCYHRCRAYEKVPGSTKELWQLWEKRYHEHVEHGSVTATPKFLKTMVKAFEELPLVTEERTKPRVGIVGTMCKVEPEFYDWLKDYLVDEEGCEVAILDFYGYAIAPSYNAMNQYKTYSFPISMKIGGYVSQKMIQTFIGWGIDAFKNSKRFDPMRHMDTVLERTWSIVPATHISGEGWFYTSQFVFLLDLGIENFICTTPFDCMPVHLGCRGAMRKLKQMFPKLNVCVLDFDAGSSRMNQLNRIRLMLNSMPERQNQGPQTTLCRVSDLEDIIGDDVTFSSSSDTLTPNCSPSACQSCSSNAGCNILRSAIASKRAQQTFIGATAEDLTDRTLEVEKTQRPIKA